MDNSSLPTVWLKSGICLVGFIMSGTEYYLYCCRSTSDIYVLHPPDLEKLPKLQSLFFYFSRLSFLWLCATYFSEVLWLCMHENFLAALGHCGGTWKTLQTANQNLDANWWQKAQMKMNEWYKDIMYLMNECWSWILQFKDHMFLTICPYPELYTKYTDKFESVSENVEGQNKKGCLQICSHRLSSEAENMWNYVWNLAEKKIVLVWL